jgi:putative glutamine amidotransferase
MSFSLVIGITECGKWGKYAEWVRANDSDAQIVKLSWKEENLDDLDRLHGVVLSGGGDVHPRFYGAPEKVTQLDPKEVDERRDEFEFEVLEKALKDRIPVFGICRGLQVANVYFGGTLVLDLPNAGKPGHAKAQGYDRTHSVSISPGTQLEKAIGHQHGEVNSAHHQAVEKIGKGLRVSAASDDGIIEGLEWQEADEKPFLLLVQWHPERMENLESPFSRNLLLEFTKAAARKL